MHKRNETGELNTLESSERILTTMPRTADHVAAPICRFRTPIRLFTSEVKEFIPSSPLQRHYRQALEKVSLPKCIFSPSLMDSCPSPKGH